MNIKRRRFAFILLLFLFFSSEVEAKRVYMDSATQNGTTWTMPEDGTINGALVPAFSLTNIQLTYSYNLVGPGVTTFIKISTNSPGSLTVRAFDTNIATTGNPLKSPEITFIEISGQTFLAVTPTVPYNSIKLTLGGLLSYATLDYAFQDPQIECGTGLTTSSTKTGSLVNPASQVTDDRNAIDSKSDTYSSIFIASQQQGVTVSQNIYFNRTWGPSDVIRFYLSGAGSLPKPIITIQKFLKGSEVFKTNPPITPADFTNGFFDLTAAGEFDQVTISLTSSSNGNKQDYELKLYEVQILPAPPVITAGPLAFCEDATTSSISISQPVTGLQYNWYDENNSPLQKGPLTSYTPADLLPGSHNIKITASRPGCPESSPASLNIYINPKPNIPTIEPLN